ncbi:anti-silencing protein, ASF1-like family protein, putative [Babesia bigemina]|uniref:Anti-silencing protein, ASF1-like family protein, putative n=1 Tax=Babesia bigemina TaxID=5866 RepID=A0A061DD61_BABBI|nr:anti-silencing protein, ASF1-like family protein, putative [Babesia bigemina]CDR95980.1 anti-silencing protein, ASF1-like family protein, putative [Babesia bigemina]|eukprot:XP_012768166.1 anti-silencing protein, ASF1-like family protein, putative [Babesia bigemina]
MSLVNVTNITVANNVCPVTAPLVFQIEFECLEDLKHDVEWKVIYVTSDGTGYVTGEQEPIDVAHSRDGEIVLDAVCLGPVCRGILEFEFRVSPPDFTRLNPAGILGMQAVLVTANYCDQEFIRIGYYTNNCYDDPLLRECPPDVPNIDKMVRCIIDQPRVTRFPIKWDSDIVVDPEGNDISQVIDDNPEENNTDGEEEDEEEYDDEGEDDEKDEEETKPDTAAENNGVGESGSLAPESGDVNKDFEETNGQQTNTSGDVDVAASSEVPADAGIDVGEADMAANENDVKLDDTTESSRSDSGSDDIDDSYTSYDASDEAYGYDLVGISVRPDFDSTADGEADNEADSNESSEDTDSDAIQRTDEQMGMSGEGSSEETGSRFRMEGDLTEDGVAVKRTVREVMTEGSEEDGKVRRVSPLVTVSTVTSITDVQ